MKYDKWYPTQQFPELWKQVLYDINHALSEDVINRLTGEEVDSIASDILRSYEAYIRNKYREELVKALSEKLGGILGICNNWKLCQGFRFPE